jgi:hypothetical protein
MRITARSDDEAERIVASVWITLEWGNLPSPRVTIKPQSPPLLMEFHFEQQVHEEIVCKQALSGDGRMSIA